MFALARYLTGSAGAGIVAGIIFAYAPYRFEHYMHMELQWAMWAPLTFLALHRLCDTGRLKYGIAFGGCIALLYVWMVRRLVLGYPPVAAMIRARLASVRLAGLIRSTLEG